MATEGTTSRRSEIEGDSSDGVRIAAPYDFDPAIFANGGVLDDRAFHKELRKRNLRMLLWTAVVFNLVYVGWSLFDYVLVPDLWFRFFALRLIAVVVTTITVAMVFRPRFRNYSFEGFWMLVVVYCSFIGPMLPLAGDGFSKYIMGRRRHGGRRRDSGVAPAVDGHVAARGRIIVSGFFFPVWTGNPPMQEVVANSFVLITAFGLAVVAALFKYDLARRDFMSRVQLATVARRESEARMVLARTSDDLQGALEKLKELDRLKSRFFANISHELRTPLTLILAPLSELASIVTGAEAGQQVRVIRRNAERLLGLINDLLDLSSLDAGGLRLNLAEMDIRSVVASVHENSMPAALADGIDLQIACDTPSTRIWGDAHRLEIVMTNLVSNALKFTPAAAGSRSGSRISMTGSRSRSKTPGSASLRRIWPRSSRGSSRPTRPIAGARAAWGSVWPSPRSWSNFTAGTIGADSPGKTGTIFTVFLPFGREHIRPEVIERRQQFEETAVRRRADDVSDVPTTRTPAPRQRCRRR